MYFVSYTPTPLREDCAQWAKNVVLMLVWFFNILLINMPMQSNILVLPELVTALSRLFAARKKLIKCKLHYYINIEIIVVIKPKHIHTRSESSIVERIPYCHSKQ